MKKVSELSILEWRAGFIDPMLSMYDCLCNEFKDVAGRLKRFPSILDKLLRFPAMDLKRMQDIGGCRIVIDDVNSALNIKLPYELIKETNYINSPKESGYRGVHRIYNVDGRLIEVQYRTPLQHLWATTVEMSAIDKPFNTKAGNADPNLLRFFVIVSALFAIEEQCPTVPNTGTKQELLYELGLLYEPILNGLITKTVTYIDCDPSRLYLLALNAHLAITGYDNAQFALNQYEYNEKNINLDSVLIATTDKRKMYPNYFIDTMAFKNKIKSYFSGEETITLL